MAISRRFPPRRPDKRALVSRRRRWGTHRAMAPSDETPPTDDVAADDVVSDASSPPDTTGEAVVRGRGSGTPFVLLGGVALVIWAIVAIVAAAVLLLWWLG